VANADVEIVGIFSSFLFPASVSILIYVFIPHIGSRYECMLKHLPLSLPLGNEETSSWPINLVVTFLVIPHNTSGLQRVERTAIPYFFPPSSSLLPITTFTEHTSGGRT